MKPFQQIVNFEHIHVLTLESLENYVYIKW